MPCPLVWSTNMDPAQVSQIEAAWIEVFDGLPGRVTDVLQALPPLDAWLIAGSGQGSRLIGVSGERVCMMQAMDAERFRTDIGSVTRLGAVVIDEAIDPNASERRSRTWTFSVLDEGPIGISTTRNREGTWDERELRCRKIAAAGASA